MKKYKFVLPILAFVFGLFIFNTNFVSAANCASGDLFNSVTGVSCSATSMPTACAAGDLFSTLTGQPCNTASTDTSTIQAQISSLLNTLFNRELAVGSKGNDVKALQQLLKSAGFLSGKVDGSFGPITQGALIKYQNQNNITATGKTDSNTMQSIESMPISTLCPVIDSGIPGISSDACPQPPTLPVTIVPPTPCPIADSGVPGTSENCTTAPTASSSPTITNITPNIGAPGIQVTITGTNFTPTGNTVIGTGNEIQNQNILSPNGTTLTFSIFALPLECPVGITTKCNPAGTYQLTVTNANGTSNSLPFTLTVPSATSTNSITVTSPSGGEQWTIGSTHTITWNTSNLTNASVNIGVLLNGVESWQIANVPGNSGSYQWTIGDSKHNETGQYQIVISTESGCTNSSGSCFGMSGTSNSFSVTSSTTPTPPVSTTPNQVSWITTSAVSGNSAYLSWGEVSVNSRMPQIATYNIYRSNSTNASPALINQKPAVSYTAQGIVYTYTDSGLSSGTYYYSVAAQDVNGLVGPLSSQASVVIQ